MISFFRTVLFFIFMNINFVSAYYADSIDIPYVKYILDNGLTLIIHEDKKAPIVSVNVWYHVGSKNESKR